MRAMALTGRIPSAPEPERPKKTATSGVLSAELSVKALADAAASAGFTMQQLVDAFNGPIKRLALITQPPVAFAPFVEHGEEMPVRVPFVASAFDAGRRALLDGMQRRIERDIMRGFTLEENK